MSFIFIYYVYFHNYFLFSTSIVIQLCSSRLLIYLCKYVYIIMSWTSCTVKIIELCFQQRINLIDFMQFILYNCVCTKYKGPRPQRRIVLDCQHSGKEEVILCLFRVESYPHYMYYMYQYDSKVLYVVTNRMQSIKTSFPTE